MPLRFHIESPVATHLSGPLLRLRGWAYNSDYRLTGVNLRIGSHICIGHYGKFRPDVRAAFPEALDDFTGFEIRTRLPAGTVRLELEFKTASDDWIQASTLNYTTPRFSRPFWSGGGTVADLIAFQLGASASHAPGPIQRESFSQPSPPAIRSTALTIVTPSFNQADYLAETATSVLADREIPVRYHVQDGNSTDESIARLETVKGGRCSWASEPDDGQADAIAKGFAQTSGEPDDLMAWINSDDFYMPGALRYVADYFARHPEVDVVYGHRILVDDQSREIGRWFLPPHDDEVLRLNDFVPQETMFWRRRIWDKVGGIDPSFKFAMDWDLLLRFQAAGAKIVRVPYFLACFRIHSAQKTSAQMESVGQKEIDALRLRTFGRALTPAEIENNPRLIRYLRKSAWIEFLWRRLHFRHP